MMGLPKEQELAIAISLICIARYFTAWSVEAWLSNVIKYSKGAVLLLAYWSDIRVFVWYIIIFGVLQLTLRTPWYRGPSAVRELGAAEFAEEVENASQTGTTLVMLYATWAQTCANFSSTFADLSLKYSRSHLRFAQVDISQAPQLALKYNIDTSMFSNHLPTLILFQQGKPMEGCRLPLQVAGNKSIALTQRNVGGYFRLKERAGAAESAAAVPSSSSSSSSASTITSASEKASGTMRSRKKQ